MNEVIWERNNPYGHGKLQVKANEHFLSIVYCGVSRFNEVIMITPSEAEEIAQAILSHSTVESIEVFE